MAKTNDHFVTNRHTGGDLILMSNNGRMEKPKMMKVLNQKITLSNVSSFSGSIQTTGSFGQFIGDGSQLTNITSTPNSGDDKWFI